MIPLTVARVFTVVSGILGIAYLLLAVLLILTPSSPSGSFIDGRSMALGIVGISILPAILGFYLLYSYARLSLGMQTRFCAKTIWITTAIFNAIGALYITPVRPAHGSFFLELLFYLRLWPGIAVCLAVLAIIKLRQKPNRDSVTG